MGSGTGPILVMGCGKSLQFAAGVERAISATRGSDHTDRVRLDCTTDSTCSQPHLAAEHTARGTVQGGTVKGQARGVWLSAPFAAAVVGLRVPGSLSGSRTDHAAG